MTASSAFHIQQANSSDIPVALEMLFGVGWSEIDKGTFEDPIEAHGLFVAKRGADIVGAGWARQHNEDGCSLLLPQLRTSEPEKTAYELFFRLDSFSQQHDHRITYCLLTENNSAMWRGQLEMHSYRLSATLRSLVCLGSRFPEQSPSIFEQLTRVDHSNQALVRKVLRTTFVASRDCPDVPTFRGVEDRIVGDHRDHLVAWLLWKNTKPIGCLALRDDPVGESLELAYIGLVPQERGRGIGKELTRVALWFAGEKKRNKVVTTVDASNGSAVNMYAQLNFIAYAERQLFLRDHPTR